MPHAGPAEVMMAARGRVVAMHTPTVEPLEDGLDPGLHPGGHTLSMPEHLRAVLAAHRGL